jgi:hypothetical protein
VSISETLKGGIALSLGTPRLLANSFRSDDPPRGVDDLWCRLADASGSYEPDGRAERWLVPRSRKTAVSAAAPRAASEFSRIDPTDRTDQSDRSDSFATAGNGGEIVAGGGGGFGWAWGDVVSVRSATVRIRRGA